MKVLFPAPVRPITRIYALGKESIFDNGEAAGLEENFVYWILSVSKFSVQEFEN
jgi:hypothetical protein